MLTPKREDRATVGDTCAEYAEETNPMRGLYTSVRVVGGLGGGEPAANAGGRVVKRRPVETAGEQKQ
jgi:hypothetical protein